MLGTYDVDRQEHYHGFAEVVVRPYLQHQIFLENAVYAYCLNEQAL